MIDILETGEIRYKDNVRQWIAKNMPERKDNLICAAVALEDRLIVKTVMHHFPVGGGFMRVTYDESDDILVLRLSEKEIVKETSQDWNTHISYAQDGTIVEMVVLETSKQGAWPLLRSQAA